VGPVPLYETLNTEAGRKAFDTWKIEPEGVERRFTVKVDRELLEPTDERRAEADEAAAILLGIPWELIHDGNGYLFQGARAVRVRRSLPKPAARSRDETTNPRTASESATGR
jgi:hypothetical protein